MTRTGRGRAAVAVLLAAMVASCTGGTATQPAAAPPPRVATLTQVLTFQAFDEQGLLPGLVRAASTGGACTGGSLAAGGRADAWRCTVGGGTVLDPCFSMEGGAEVACVPDPFTRDVTMVRIGGALSRGNRNDPGHAAWFLELMDGARCGFVPGPSAMIADRRLTYTCTGGTAVYGEPDGTRPVWTVRAQVSGASPDLAGADVKVAWY